MPSLSDIEAFRSVLADLNILMVEDLTALWREIADEAPDVISAVLQGAVPEVLTPYIVSSSDLAATWYGELASAPFTVHAAAPPPAEQIQASVRWATGPLYGRGAAPVLDLLAGAAQRYVLGGARNTLVTNAEREGVRWARHASANACAFCRMLATRGAVYATRNTAMQAHDNCHCLPVPIRRGDAYRAPAYVSDWMAEYNAARSATDGSTTAILAEMRRQS